MNTARTVAVVITSLKAMLDLQGKAITQATAQYVLYRSRPFINCT
jgi:hypothetical protein